MPEIKKLDELVINKVKNKEIFNYMKNNGLVNEDEMYLVEDDDSIVGISSIEQTTTSTEDGGTNVITITLTNGTSTTFNVKNGSKGSTGANGTNGADGYTPQKGVDYWTDEDKTEIINAVIAALPDGSNISY